MLRGIAVQRVLPVRKDQWDRRGLPERPDLQGQLAQQGRLALQERLVLLEQQGQFLLLPLALL